MLGRIGWWLRFFLFLAGVAALLALPLSLMAQTRINLYVPWGEFDCTIEDGAIKAWAFPPGSLYYYEPHLIDVEFRRGSTLDDALAWGVFPTGNRSAMYATLPLWLLAVLCLAWPVTSYLLARRRRRRGFSVEAALSTPLPPGEVPSLRGGEGGRRKG